MALPFSRNTTYVQGSQVKSADLDAIQDAIVAEHNRSIYFGPGSFLPGSNTPNWFTQGRTIDRENSVSSGITELVCDITPWLIPGDTIKEFVGRWYNGATAAAGNVAILLKHASIATGDLIGTLATGGGNTSTGGASASRNVTTSVAHTVLSTSHYWLYVTIDDTANDDDAGFRGVSLVLGV